MTQRIYLASQSLRRRELLRQIGVRFELLVFRRGEGDDAEVDETPQPGEAAADYVARLALTKAEAGVQRLIWRRLPAMPVLAADTALELDGRIIGKPGSAGEAIAILEQLSGREHTVLTAVAISHNGHTRSALNRNQVRFRSLSSADIRAYVATGEPMDKAGAYGIQGRAAVFVEAIHGSHSGIMGLPLFETAQLLESFGYPVLK